MTVVGELREFADNSGENKSERILLVLVTRVLVLAVVDGIFELVTPSDVGIQPTNISWSSRQNNFVPLYPKNTLQIAIWSNLCEFSLGACSTSHLIKHTPQPIDTPQITTK